MKAQFNLTIEEDLKEKIQIRAIEEKRSVSAIVEELLNEYLKEDKDENKEV